MRAEEPTQFMLTKRRAYRNLDVVMLQLNAQRGLDRQSKWFMKSVSYTEMEDATFVLLGDIVLLEIRY